MIMKTLIIFGITAFNLYKVHSFLDLKWNDRLMNIFNRSTNFLDLSESHSFNKSYFSKNQKTASASICRSTRVSRERVTTTQRNANNRHYAMSSSLQMIVKNDATKKSKPADGQRRTEKEEKFNNSLLIK